MSKPLIKGTFDRDSSSVCVIETRMELIDADKLSAFRLLAAHLLAYEDAALAAAVEAGVLTEVTGGEAVL